MRYLLAITAAIYASAGQARCLDPDDSIPANRRMIESGEPCKRSSPKPPLKLPSSTVIGLVSKAVVANFKDPDAARFRWMPTFDPDLVCGMVNGKNSFGGYVGYVRFYALLDRNGADVKISTLHVITDESSPAEARLAEGLCTLS